MSSKRAMKQAQKQAYARHRSNISSSRFETKKETLQRIEKKINFLSQIFLIFYKLRF